MLRKVLAPFAGWLLALAASAAWAQAPYTYMKFSLRVPWTLYFVFLACVSIPFIVMIVLAWRDHSGDEAQDDTAERQEQSLDKKS